MGEAWIGTRYRRLFRRESDNLDAGQLSYLSKL